MQPWEGPGWFFISFHTVPGSARMSPDSLLPFWLVAATTRDAKKYPPHGASTPTPWWGADNPLSKARRTSLCPWKDCPVILGISGVHVRGLHPAGTAVLWVSWLATVCVHAPSSRVWHHRAVTAETVHCNKRGLGRTEAPSSILAAGKMGAPSLTSLTWRHF